MTEQALFAEREFLASEPQRGGRLAGADVGERHADVERRAKRRRHRPHLLVADACVVQVGLEAEPRLRRHGDVQAHAAQGVVVVALVDEAAALEAFDALTELAANPQPRGQVFVGAVEDGNACGGRRLGLSRRRGLLLRGRGGAGGRLRGLGGGGRADEQGCGKAHEGRKGRTRANVHAIVSPSISTIESKPHGCQGGVWAR